MPNWFEQNAPKSEGGDWFAQNAPSRTPEQTKQTLKEKYPNHFGDEQPGAVSRFMSGAGEAIKGAVEFLPNMRSGGRLALKMLEGQQAEKAKAKEYSDAGRPSEAFGHNVAASIPGGPIVADLVETAVGEPSMPPGKQVGSVREPDVAGAIGKTAAGVGLAAAPKVAGAAKAKASQVVKNFTAVEPRKAIVQAVKPRSSALGFEPALERALPELKATESQLGKPIASAKDAMEATKAAKQRVWGQYEQAAGPARAMGAVVDLSPVADAMVASIPGKIRLENPARAAQIEAKAQKYRRQFPIEEAEGFLKTANAELDAYHGKYPTMQRAELAKNPQTAALYAQAEAFRDAIYKTLDGPGEGSVPRELKRRYGSLLQFEEELQRRINVAERQQPESLSQQVGKWHAVGQGVKGVARLAMKDPVGAADIASALAQRKAANWLKEQQATDALIRRAFENYSGSPSPLNLSQPAPRGLLGPGAIRMGPVPDPSGVNVTTGSPLAPKRAPLSRRITSGDVVTPPPADTSGSKAGAPYMGRGMAPDVGSRRLPPPSQVPVGGFATAEELVPVKHPVTGQIEYVPKWTLQKVPRFARGGIIRRPTMGIVGEEGPEAIIPLSSPDSPSAAIPTVPETPATMKLQMEQLAQGERRVVMFPRGTPLIKRPKGMREYKDESGNTYVYDPSKTSQPEIDKAIATNTLPDLLGATDGGMGAPDKSRILSSPDSPMAVVGTAKDGTTAQATVTDRKHAGRTVEQTKKLTPKGGRVQIRPPQHEIARRLRG